MNQQDKLRARANICGAFRHLTVTGTAIGCMVAISLEALSAPHHCEFSDLWGSAGERWQPEVNLPDFSWAGYHAGEAPIPSATADYDLRRDFHAAGDGRADDTAALENALQSISRGVLFIPEGTYVITREIEITKGNVVLRGAGHSKTVLLFPHSLEEVYGNKPENSQSQWSFGPGFIHVAGRDSTGPETLLAAVSEPARRGDRSLTLASPIRVERGQWIRLTESDPANGHAAGSLIHFLYGDLMPAGPDLIGARDAVRFLSRIASASGNHIVLERPLPYDIRPEWKPEVHSFDPALQEFGIERLSIRFPWSPYPGHFREHGFNAISIDKAADCWIDDLEIQNADFGIGLNGTNFCTVRNVILSVSANRAMDPAVRGWNGHHGIDASHGTENLITGFDIRTRFVHDISVEWYALHTVYSEGRGMDLAMDHHREANYSSLFTDLDCGAGTRPFFSGGSRDRGAHSGAYSTFWNIRASSPMPPPPPDFGPRLILVGVDTAAAPRSDYQWTVEKIHRDRLCPANLYEAMRARR